MTLQIEVHSVCDSSIESAGFKSLYFFLILLYPKIIIKGCGNLKVSNFKAMDLSRMCKRYLLAFLRHCNFLFPIQFWASLFLEMFTYLLGCFYDTIQVNILAKCLQKHAISYRFGDNLDCVCVWVFFTAAVSGEKAVPCESSLTRLLIMSEPYQSNQYVDH